MTDDIPDWRLVAAALAWSQAGQPHTVEEQHALDPYDAAVRADIERGIPQFLPRKARAMLADWEEAQ